MKKPFLTLVILSLVSIVSMVIVSQVYAQATRIYVDPSSFSTSQQPNRTTTIRPNNPGSYGDWTDNTYVIRPMSEGTSSDWTGRIRTLNPNGAGTFSEWNAWTHLQPRTDGNYTGWLGTAGNYRDWDDWEDYGGGVYYDGDTSYAYTNLNNRNETSALTRLPTERKGLSITKVKVNVVARNTTIASPKTPAEREGFKIILCTVLNANVSQFVADTGWDGWSRNSPWLNASDYPSHYISTSVANDRIGNFTFYDVPSGITGSTVTLYLKTWKSGDLGGSDYMNIYLYNGTKWSTAYQFTPTSTTAPGTLVSVDVSSWLNTLAKVNATIMAIEKKTSGSADTIGVDHAYITVSGGPTPFDANVNGRIAVSGWDGWTKVGTTKWLNKEDYPANYIYSGATTDKIGNFTFYDVPSGITWTPTGGVQVRLRTWQSPGPPISDDTLKIYVFDGTNWSTARYLPTIPSGYPDYRDVDVSTWLNTVAKINAAKLAIEKVTNGDPDTIFVDYACIRLSGVSTASSSSPKIEPTSSYALYSYEWSTNPVYSGLVWNWTAINELQAGVRSVQGGTTFSGAIRVTQLYVGIFTAAGLYTDWDDWPDPTGPNKGDEDYFNATADVKRQSSALTDTTLPGWGTVKVRVTVVARQTAGPEDLTIMLVISGTVYSVSGSKVTPSQTAYTEYSYEWTTNPAGGAWTESAINAMEAGVRSEKVGGAFTGAICVTQLYVQVIEAGNFALWDDEPWSTPSHDGDDTYNSAVAAVSRSSQLQDIPTTWSTWTISRVQVTIVAKTNLPTDEKVRIMLIISGAPTPYYGTSYTLTTGYTTYTDVWTVNPYGGGSWDRTTINAMQAGVQSILGDDGVWKREIRVTQLYVVVGRDGTYQNWDEESLDENDYLSATMADMFESSHLTEVSDQGWTIGRVSVAIVAKTNVTTDERVQPFLIVDSTKSASEAIPLTTSYQTYTRDWGKNPKLNTPWEWGDLTNLQAGVQVVQIGEWKGEIRVAQLYVQIAGPRFTIDVKVENVVNLYGYSIKLKYNTAVTTATAIIFYTTFIPPRSDFQPTEVNDAAGYVSFGTISNTGQQSGSGPLAKIIFLIDSTGATTLDLDVIDFYNYALEEIHTILGDMDDDRDVDTPDLSILSNDYGSKPGDSNWNLGRCDFDSNGKVDVRDLFDQSRNYGKTIVYDGYFSNTYP